MRLLQPTATAGRLARSVLRLLPRNAVLRVLSGPNRGRRWAVGAGTHGCWLGTYERQELTTFLALVDSDDIVWDIGAHGGYFTLACAAKATQVIACEANPLNASNLRRHLALNEVANVSVVEAAICSTHNSSATFGGRDIYQGRLGGGSDVVATATLDGLIRDGLPAPTVVKMDIEGGELDALAGGVETLSAFRPTMLVAVHSAQLRQGCENFLRHRGYAVTELNIGTLLARSVGPE